MNHEASRLPNFRVTKLSNPRLRDQLEHCMGDGLALVVTGTPPLFVKRISEGDEM